MISFSNQTKKIVTVLATYTNRLRAQNRDFRIVLEIMAESLYKGSRGKRWLCTREAFIYWESKNILIKKISDALLACKNEYLANLIFF